MKSLSTNLINEKNALSSKNPWLILLTITLPDSTIIRIVNGTQDITYGPNVYNKFSFSIGIIEQDISGGIPAVKLQISNVTRLLANHLNEQDGGLGSTVVITVVNTGHLSEDYSELELEFTVMGCDSDEKYVTWTLGMANPVNQRFPLYRYIPGCLWASNFKGAECGYSGDETECDGLFSTCLQYGNTDRFVGFLGMARNGIRIA